jgi:phosphate transport system substrate-binding protein
MSFSIGRCTSTGYCDIADAGREITVAEGGDFVCPACGRALQPVAAKIPDSGWGKSKTVRIAAICGATAAALVAGYGVAVFVQNASPARQAAATDVTAPAGAPPLRAAALAPAASPAPVVSAAPVTLLRIAGANTLTTQLAPNLASAYLSQVGDTNITMNADTATHVTTVTGTRGNARESIVITTLATDEGFGALADGQADIALTTRRITPEENARMGQRGDLTDPSREHVLALDGIAVVVNATSALDHVTLAQLRGLYTGTIHNWSELGGKPGPVHAWSWPQGTGTYDLFSAAVLGGAAPASVSSDRLSDEDGQTVANVSADRNAIAFVSQAHIGSARAVALGTANGKFLLPTDVNIATEEYPLSRRLYLYAPGSPGNVFVARFTEFAESDAGQALTADAGFVAQTLQVVTTQTPQTAAAEPSDPYHQLIAGAQRLSADFRFVPGSNDLDARSLRDMDRLADLLDAKHWSGDQLILVGFSDASGSPSSNLAISRERAKTVAAVLANRGIVANTVTGFGSASPVADNATEDGRERNRRVEVYLRDTGVKG